MPRSEAKASRWAFLDSLSLKHSSRIRRLNIDPIADLQITVPMFHDSQGVTRQTTGNIERFGMEKELVHLDRNCLKTVLESIQSFHGTNEPSRMEYSNALDYNIPKLALRVGGNNIGRSHFLALSGKG